MGTNGNYLSLVKCQNTSLPLHFIPSKYDSPLHIFNPGGDFSSLYIWPGNVIEIDPRD